MTRSAQLDPSRQYRKLYKRGEMCRPKTPYPGISSTGKQTVKFDKDGRVSFGGSTYGKMRGPVKLRLMVLRLYLNKRSLTDTLETLINAAYEATPACHHLMPEDHPLLAWEKAQEAQRRVLANQFRVTQNHYEVTGEYVPWERLSQTHKDEARERLGIRAAQTHSETAP